jgi:hypothetical protein
MTFSPQSAVQLGDQILDVDGSRSVIVRGDQNPSRAPPASASPQTLDRTWPTVAEIAAIGSQVCLDRQGRSGIYGMTNRDDYC